MGDRRNVELQYEDGGKVYLYTHWEGTELPSIVAEALSSPEGRARWHDETYLARIIFTHMTGQQDDAETGFGIAPYPLGGNHENIVVDFEAKTVDGYPYEDYIARQDYIARHREAVGG